MKISSLATVGQGRIDLQLPPSPPGNDRYLTISLKKVPSTGLFHLTQRPSRPNRPISRASVKTNQWQLFNMALPEVRRPVGAN